VTPEGQLIRARRKKDIRKIVDRSGNKMMRNNKKGMTGAIFKKRGVEVEGR